MMKQALSILLAGAALLPGRSAGAAEPLHPEALLVLPSVKGLHPAFKSDARMQKQVTVARADIPISDLLKLLTEQTSVPLKADGDTGWMMATAGLRKRPLGEVLTLLSTHFGLLWRRGGGGYILWKDLATTRREARLEAEDEAALVQRALRIGRLALLPPLQVKERLKSVEERLSQNPADDVRLSLLTELEDLRRSLDGPFAYQALARAPAHLVQKLLEEKSLVLSSRDGSLSAEQVEGYLAERRTSIDSVEGTFRELRLVFNLGARADQVATAFLHIETYLIQGQDRGPTESRLGKSSGDIDFSVQDPRLKKTNRKLTGSFTHPSGFIEGPAAYAWTLNLLRFPEKLPTLGDLLIAIHQDCGLDVLGDSFIHYRQRYIDYRWQPSTYENVLRQNVSRYTLACRLDGDLLRVRSQTPSQMQKRQIQPRIMETEIDRLSPEPSSLLRALVSLEDRLTIAQQGTLVTYWGYLWRNGRIFVPSDNRRLELPRLINRFSPAAREQILSGKTLPLSILMPADARVVQDVLAETRRRADPAVRQPQPATGPPAQIRLVRMDVKEIVFRINDPGQPPRWKHFPERFLLDPGSTGQAARRKHVAPRYTRMPYTGLSYTYQLQLQNSGGERIGVLGMTIVTPAVPLPSDTIEAGVRKPPQPSTFPLSQ